MITTGDDNAPAYDVIVVGGGNAALCAAITAREEGAKVLLLERAPEAERGGNSSFTEGLMRFVYDGSDDIRALSPDLSPTNLPAILDATRKTRSSTTWRASRRTGQIRIYAEILVKQSNATMHWMRRQGVRFLPQFGRQAFKVDGKFTFWGGGLWPLSEAVAVWSISYTGRRRKPASTFSMTPGSGIWSVPILALPASWSSSTMSRRSFPPGASCSHAGDSRRTGLARPSSRSWLGSGEGSRQQIQLRRRPRHGSAYRSPAGGSLVRLPCGRLGALCRRLRQLRYHGRLRAG